MFGKVSLKNINSLLIKFKYYKKFYNFYKIDLEETKP